jgi:hypothetical protein
MTSDARGAVLKSRKRWEGERRMVAPLNDDECELDNGPKEGSR